MTEGYRFMGGDERRVSVGPLPEGDYQFEVADYQEPYQKANGNWVLEVRLTIQGQVIFDQPWSGETSQGEPRDGIGEFLFCVNRAPRNKGDGPDWRKLIGARGKCRLKTEVAQMGSMAGKEVNRVAYYYRPKEVGPTAAPEQSVTDAGWADQQRRSKQAAGAPGDDEPNEIPF